MTLQRTYLPSVSEGDTMKKLLLCLLTLSCITSIAPHQFIESRTKICRELWHDAKTIVVTHPYATAIIETPFLYFIFWYSRDEDDVPCCEGVPHHTKQNLEMHACIPAHVKRPPNFWKKPVKPVQEESEL